MGGTTFCCLRSLPILMFFCFACRADNREMESRLEAWQLPHDLATRQAQLTELHLPQAVDSLTWLAGDQLEEVAVHGTGLRSLAGVPASVVRLDVTFTLITSLEHLPSSLRSLDLRATSIDRAIDLPDALEELGLSGTAAANLRFLPQTLQTLAVDGAKDSVLRDFPPALKKLCIYGGSVEALENLPDGLEKLRLHATGIRSLPDLPRSIERLELVQNPTLYLPSLPNFLRHLTLDNQRLPDFGNLQYLQTLEIKGEFSSIPQNLPRSLERFHVDLFEEAAPPALSPALRDLGLLRWSGPLPAIPQNVESLDLSDYSGESLDLSQYRLKSLTLARAAIQTLHLPEGLETLDVSRTGVPGLGERLKDLRDLKTLLCWSCSLALSELPPGLTGLDVRDSRALQKLGPLPPSLKTLNVSRTALTSLGDLEGFSDLRELDISNSKIRELRDLPQGLHKLTVHAGQIQSLGALPASVRILHFVEPD